MTVSASVRSRVAVCAPLRFTPRRAERMGMSAVVRSLPKREFWTVDDVWALPSRAGYRYEVLHGELLVTPPPANAHQGPATELTVVLAVWARARGEFAVRSPGGVYISPTTWLEPDVAVYPAPRHSTASWVDLPPPVLVAEVLSPSTRKRDRHRKRPAYLAHGVGEVWIVDHERRMIERWTSASEFPEVVTDRIEWSPRQGVEPLVFALTELFGVAAE
jgi:Uma2 family endonuclease